MKKIINPKIVIIVLILGTIFAATTVIQDTKMENHFNTMESELNTSATASLLWSFQADDQVYCNPALFDVDHDGKLEVFFGSHNSTIYALSGESGSLMWDHKTGDGWDSIHSSPAIGDVDDDGYLEVLIGSTNQHVYSLNSLTGNTEWTTKFGGVVDNPIVLGDVNGDEELEVVVHILFSGSTGNIKVLHGENGSVLWEYLGGAAYSPSLGDVDGDGKLEVVAGTYVFNGEDGTPVWSRNLNCFSSPAIGDIDGDGKLEVVFGTSNSRVYALNGEDGTTAWWRATEASIVWSSPALGDVDGDGKLEVVVGSTESGIGNTDNYVYVFNGEDGSVEWKISTGNQVWSSPAIGDVDGDGKLEVVIGSDDRKVYAINGKDGSISWSYQTGGLVRSSPSLGDLDGDGTLEVVIGCYDYKVYAIKSTPSGEKIVWQGLAGTDFYRMKSFPLVSELWNYPTGDDITSSSALGDIDEDGKLEVIIGSHDDKVYALNSEDGTELWNYATGSSISCSPALGDIDGDGKLEVVVGSDDNYLYALNGENGNLIWQFDTQSDVDSSPALGDVDGDGKLEVIFGNTYDGRIFALNGENGGVLWSHKTNYIIISSPALGDVDGDGKLEVVIGSGDHYLYALNGESGSLRWKYNTGDDIYSSPAIGDVDGDGKFEVVVGSYNGKIYAINGKDGTEIWNYTTASRIMSSPAIADIDGDRRFEVVVGSYDNKIYAINGEDGTETWNFQTGDQVYSSPAIGDIDGDGKFEVIVGSYDDNIYAINGEDGTKAWNYQLGGNIISSPALGDVDGDGKLEIIVGSDDNKIYALNPTTSGEEVLWQGLAGKDFLRPKFTDEISDTLDPIIIDAPSDFNIEFGYTGINISWTATDLHSHIYTIELQGSGIVAGPDSWSNNTPINYTIPDGLDVGVYIYTINFTDSYGQFATDTVIMTIDDTIGPTITDTPSDFNIEFGYTGISISWTATDPHPNTYLIELQGFGIVAGPDSWLSNTPINYTIPDGLNVGEYIYTVNFTDNYGNFATHTVTMTIEDTIDPVITDAPSDFTVDYGYSGVNISWTATDPHPNTYTIELQGSGIVAGPASWSSGVAIVYIIPEGLSSGEYIFTINFTDAYGNSIADTIAITVKEVKTTKQPNLLPIIIGTSIAGIIAVISIPLIVKKLRRREK